VVAMPKNEKCAVSDSAVCKWLDKDCGSCYINGLKNDNDAKKVLENFEVTLSLLPENFDDLQEEDCQFCKGKQAKRSGYAVIDMAHSEPESKKGMFFGLGKKVKQSIGSLMPVSISICKECKRSFRIYESLKWFSIVVFLAIAIVLIIIPSIGKAINSISLALPYGVLMLGGVIGFIVGKIASAMYMKAKSDTMRFNVYDLPVCLEMKENGWFTVQDNGLVLRFIFSKKSRTKKVKDLKDAGNNPKEVFTQASFLKH